MITRNILQVISLDWIPKHSLICGYQLHDPTITLSKVEIIVTSSLDSLYECNVSDYLIIVMNQDWYPINYFKKTSFLL